MCVSYTCTYKVGISMRTGEREGRYIKKEYAVDYETIKMYPNGLGVWE